MAHADLAELARVERHVARRMGRGLGTASPTITELTPDQQNQVTALTAVAWAMLDAESRGDSAGARSLVPVFIASYNAWNAGVRRIFVNAPSSLPTSGWTTNDDNALTLTIATYAWMQQRTDAQIHAMLGSFPTGSVPNAYRGTIFMTQIAPQFQAPLFDHAVSAFRSGGASGMSSFSDSVSQGTDPAIAATPAPAPPTRPPVTTPRTSTPIELPGMTITAPAPRSGSITWPWYVLGGAVAIGLGTYGYFRIKRGKA